jgi:hypothetical protein
MGMILQRLSDWWFKLRAKNYWFENSGKTVVTIKNTGRRSVVLRLEGSYPPYSLIEIPKVGTMLLGPFPTGEFGLFGVNIHYTGKAEFKVQDFSKEAAAGKLEVSI